MLPAKDISRWDGAWTDEGEAIIMVKISGGDQGLYVDPDAQANYDRTIAAGKAFGGYHFAGGGNPQTEAMYFLNAMKPWNPGEVPALDIESGQTWNPNAPGVDPVAWTMGFINQVEASTGNSGGLVYMNLNTLNLHDWTPVLNRWGLWLADWTGDPTGATVNTTKTVVMLQYSDGPNYDHDEWYGTVDQFKAYGWHPTTPVAAPAPPPAPVVVPTPTPVAAPTPVQAPTPVVTNPPSPTPTPTPAQTGSEAPIVDKPVVGTGTPNPAEYYKLWELIVAILKKLFGRK